MGTGQAGLERGERKRKRPCQNVENPKVMRSTTATLIARMRLEAFGLATLSNDGIVKSCIEEAADRLEELQNAAREVVGTYDECDLCDEHVDKLRDAAI